MLVADSECLNLDFPSSLFSPEIVFKAACIVAPKRCSFNSLGSLIETFQRLLTSH